MKALKTVVIQVANKGLTERIPVVQSDSGRSIDFIISDMKILSTASASIYAVKPDGKLIFNDCTISSNTITVNLTTQTLAVDGAAICQLRIISGVDIVTTFEFVLDIKKSIVSDSAIESTNEFGALQNALATVTGLQGEIDKLNIGDSGNGYYINTCVDKPITLNSRKRIFLFADSVGTSTHGGFTWASIITEKTGVNFNNYSVGGAVFAENSTNNIIAQVNGVTDWSTCDYVIIAAGTNDASQKRDFVSFRKSVENTR